MAKNPLASAGDASDVGSPPGRKNPLEKEMATHSSILALEILWTEEPGGLQSLRLQKVAHDLATKQQQQALSEVRLFVLKFDRRKVAG